MTMTMTIHRAALLAALLAIVPATPAVLATDDDDKKAGIDAEGYVSSWLVLAPIKLEESQEGPEALAKEQVKDEAKLQPKAGEKIEAGGKQMAWKVATAEEGLVDFNKFLGEETEHSVAYAATYLIVEDDTEGVTLKVGSDDQVRIFLNGKLVHSNDDDRPFEKDDDSIDGLTLKKGRNVLVMKVVNGEADWIGSVRLLNKDGAPIKGLKATTESE